MFKLVVFASLLAASASRPALLVIDMSEPMCPRQTVNRTQIIENIKYLMSNTTVKYDLIIDSHLALDCDEEWPNASHQPALCGLWRLRGNVSAVAPVRILPDLEYNHTTFVVKESYSAFYNSNIDAMLKASKIDTVHIVGVFTDCCIAATAQDAWQRGYQVVVVEDAVSSFSEAVHREGVVGMKRIFCAQEDGSKCYNFGLVKTSDIAESVLSV